MYIKPPKFVRRIFPSLVWEMPPSEEVYLTFDDGPTPGVTEMILEQLAKYGAKATFFCLGKNAEMHPELFQRIVAEGHRIGNHTYSHQKGWRMSLEGYLEDVEFANNLLHTDLFRPPYGQITPTQARRLSEHYNLIMWDVLSQDYNRRISPRLCLRNVTKHVKGGCFPRFAEKLPQYVLCVAPDARIFAGQGVEMCRNRAVIRDCSAL